MLVCKNNHKVKVTNSKVFNNLNSKSFLEKARLAGGLFTQHRNSAQKVKKFELVTI